ncbi:MAG: 3-methyl-2-oxobutanoate hydroxymethyltransferase [Thaumarchaeota archaeon]|nr:3-methyl-2-oxobutanoate hydroxymethyltransferase [Nitrososphaerota archaeon]
MSERGKLTISDIAKMKSEGKKIVVVTAYDYPFAAIAARVGVDMILVGDSGGMVSLGYENTIPVSMDEMLMMSKAVARAAKSSLLVGDMPFMSFQISRENALRNAGRFVKEGRMDAVKIEGGREFSDTVRAITKAGIPVMGHVGLTPQTATLWQGYRVQGKDARSARKLIEDAQELESAGAFAVVLEMVPEEVAQIITDKLGVPTIGIGAGKHCDGQVLVLHDILGLYEKFTPRFAKRYADLGKAASEALAGYRDDVITGRFPAQENSFKMDAKQLERLKASFSKLAETEV